MNNIEREGINLLEDRLDESLLNHAAAMSRDSPTIVEIYQLQGLAEIHCYLKAVHEITPDEAEALLRFVDPLEVAYACWEENPHIYSFPICELLQEIRAVGRFPLAYAAAPDPHKKRSIQEQLRTAMEEARRTQPAHEHSRSGDAR